MSAPTSNEPKTIVVLGGGYAGLHVAHAILQKRKDVKVIVVSKNDHFYWNLAAPRAIIPGQLSPDKILTPIRDILGRYPPETWELVVGSAEAVDFTEKTVTVLPSNAAESRVIKYEHLVIATGSRPQDGDVPWKARGTSEELRGALNDVSAAVGNAKHITVGGAGGTGIEVAGELGAAFGSSGDKEIHLLAADGQLAGGHTIAPFAAKQLEKIGVKIHYNARVESATPVEAVEGGTKTELKLSSGESLVTDLYLPTTGLLPNTDFIPAQYLTEPGRTIRINKFLQVQDASNVWAAGDVVGQPRAGFMITQRQAAGVARNLLASLDEKKLVPWKAPEVDIFACAIGPKAGVGRINNKYSLPAFLVKVAKSRDLGVGMSKGYINGNIA
ncbi:hypothetical protein VTJ04DRAFT_5534 [Mycothermus thermophilus]|uniref:uncharacterized protein n=1 Tax=Humicola insolens TaxID=85995 RepID=UPI0037447811